MSKPPQKSIADGIARPKDLSKKNKRSETQKAADLEFFEYWHLRGKTEYQLAEMIAEIRPYTLSRAQINQDLLKSKRKWQDSALVHRNEAIGKELAGLQAQEDELWTAWEKSKKKKANKTPAKKTKTKSENERDGDGYFQKLILEVREQRRKILGLDASKQVVIGGIEGGAPIKTKEENPLAGLTVEELRELASFKQ